MNLSRDCYTGPTGLPPSTLCSPTLSGGSPLGQLNLVGQDLQE